LGVLGDENFEKTSKLSLGPELRTAGIILDADDSVDDQRQPVAGQFQKAARASRP